jgi:hypothetical protein
MTTRPNHPLPRQDLHLQACQRPKAAHRNLPLCAEAARLHQVQRFNLGGLKELCSLLQKPAVHLPLLLERSLEFSLRLDRM